MGNQQIKDDVRDLDIVFLMISHDDHCKKMLKIFEGEGTIGLYKIIKIDEVSLMPIDIFYQLLQFVYPTFISMKLKTGIQGGRNSSKEIISELKNEQIVSTLNVNPYIHVILNILYPHLVQHLVQQQPIPVQQPIEVIKENITQVTDEDLSLEPNNLELILNTLKNDKCCVCFESFNTQQSIIINSCSHVYHKKCVKNLDICPFCRIHLDV